MWEFTRYARSLVPGVLGFWVGLFGLPCLAQEVGAPDRSEGRGSVLAPSGYLEQIIPVHDRIALQAYGFYVGKLKAPVAQLDVPVRATRFLTITPSYMYYSVPASGLDELASRPGGFADAYGEHQFRIGATFTFPIRKLEISDRSMYVRRFRPTPATDINRYRNRLMVTYPVAVTGHIWKPFAAYEAYYDGGPSAGWNTHRVWTGITVPLKKAVWLQPSYMWESDRGTKNIHYLLFGLIVSTR